MILLLFPAGVADGNGNGDLRTSAAWRRDLEVTAQQCGSFAHSE